MAHGLQTHGHKVGYKPSPTYIVWATMIARCTRDTNASFKHYGAKGITVCERWLKFENFLEDMGERPVGLTLDREDTTKGYTPDNCRWATRKEQAREKQRLLTHGGITLSVSDWADRLGMKRKTLSHRLNGHGWSVEKALTTQLKGG